MPWAYRGIVSGIELGEWSAVIAFVTELPVDGR